ncbi:MAG TPA: hypothetical protein VKT76_13950, partial [Bradyrhizobium sp.]|nr:hypothetical protein [Bradyrhizobium sp.]
KLSAHTRKRGRAESLGIDVSARCCTKTTQTRANLPDRAAVLAANRVSRKSANLRLAAQPGVGHIRADGAVAEWLKAAVC